MTIDGRRHVLVAQRSMLLPQPTAPGCPVTQARWSRRAEWAVALCCLLWLALTLAGPSAAVAADVSPHGAPGEKSLCLDCHDPHLGGFEPLLRYPTGDAICWACHNGERAPLPAPKEEYEGSPHFRGLGGGQESPATCTGCHEPHGRRIGGPKLLRGTTAAGAAASIAPGPAGAAVQDAQPVSSACGACHPDILPERAAGRSFTSLDVYRMTRHADPQRGARRPGAASGTGECTACHAPHGSGNPSLLRAGLQLACYPCHSTPAGGQSLWTGEKTFRRSTHAEVCLGCHNPHGVLDAQTGKVLPKALLAGEYELCVTCHPDIGHKFAESRRAEDAFGVRSRHPVDEAGSTVRCVSCHNPHQVRANPDGYQPALTDPDSGKLFLWLNGTTSQEYCLRCHDGSWAGAPNIQAEIANPKAAVSEFVWAGRGLNLHHVHLAKYHKQKCSSCHDPHATPGVAGVNRGRLLVGLTITEFQGGYPGFASCETNCHHARCASCHPAPPDWERAQ